MRLSSIGLILLLSLTLGCDGDHGADTDADVTDEIVVIDEDLDADEPQDDHDHGEDDEEHELADDLAPGDTGHFGDEFALDGDPIDLVDALAKLEDADGESIDIKVLAQSTEVCESRGCWMNLYHADEDLPVRVRMENYGFFVPRNATGAETVVEGTMSYEELSEDDAQHHARHIAEQTDQAIDDVPLETHIVKLKARAIEMTMPEES